MYCAYCGKEIPSESIFCRHCGKKQDDFSSSNTNELPKNEDSPQASSVQKQIASLQDKKKFKTIEALIFIAAFFIMVLFKFGPEIKEAFYNLAPKDNPIQAAAKTLVSEKVVSPSSIKWKTVDILEKDNYGRYLIDVQFESKNEFGVDIASYMLVVLQSIAEDGYYEYYPFFAVYDYETQDLKKTGIKIVKELNKWNVRIDDSEDKEALVADIDMSTPEPSIDKSPSTNADIPTDNKALTDIQILSILEEACAAEYHLYTSYDESTLESGMVKLLPDFNTTEKIETYLSSYWSDSDIDRIKYNIVFKDGVSYVPYGDPAAHYKFTQGQVLDRKFINVYDDNHNVVGDELRVTVELTVYGELQSFWYELSYDNTTNSWRVMTLY